MSRTPNLLRWKLRRTLCTCTGYFEIQVSGDSVGLRSTFESAGLTKVSAMIAINGFGRTGRMFIWAVAAARKGGA